MQHKLTAIEAIFLTLAAAAASPGAVRFYFTSSAADAGLTDMSHVFDDTDGNGTDSESYVLNGTQPDVGVPTVDPTKGEFLYLWVEFENAANGRKIQGIDLVANDQAYLGSQTESDRGIYLGDDRNGSGDKIRWELNSTTTDEMSLWAITTPGIVNGTRNGWLYYGSKSGRRIALLGALNVDLPKDGADSYGLRLGLGQNGVSYSNQWERAPKVKFGGNDEEFDGNVRDQPEFYWSSDADAVVIPEPATAIPLSCASVAVWRRRRD